MGGGERGCFSLLQSNEMLKIDGAFPIPERTTQHFDGSGSFVGCETQSGRVCLVLSEDAVYWFVYSLSEAYLR